MKEPIKLAPIKWGKRDRELANAVCQHVVEATPPTIIPANPLKHARMRRCLNHLGICA